MKRRHREALRRYACISMVALYLLVTSSANLFHTEFYQHSEDNNNPPANLRQSANTVRGEFFFAGGESRTVSSTHICPVCAFLKTYHSQVLDAPILVSHSTRPAPGYQAVEVVFPHKHPLPALQTRAPPV